MDNYNWFTNRAKSTLTQKSASFINNAKHWPSANILHSAKSDLTNPIIEIERTTNDNPKSSTSLIAKGLL